MKRKQRTIYHQNLGIQKFINVQNQEQNDKALNTSNLLLQQFQNENTLVTDPQSSLKTSGVNYRYRKDKLDDLMKVIFDKKEITPQNNFEMNEHANTGTRKINTIMTHALQTKGTQMADSRSIESEYGKRSSISKLRV